MKQSNKGFGSISGLMLVRWAKLHVKIAKGGLTRQEASTQFKLKDFGPNEDLFWLVSNLLHTTFPLPI